MNMKKQNEDEDEEANEDEDEEEEADEEEDTEEEEDKNGFVQHLEPRACLPSWTSGVPSSFEERQKKNHRYHNRSICILWCGFCHLKETLPFSGDCHARCIYGRSAIEQLSVVNFKLKKSAHRPHFMLLMVERVQA